MRSRLAAWLVTGPVGHGYAAVLDVAGLVATLVGRRLRARRHRRPPA